MAAPPDATATAMAASQMKTAERSNRSPADDGHDAPWSRTTLASGAPYGYPATYDDKTASFKHCVNIECDTSFRLKQVTKYYVNGHHVLVLVPAGTFRFLDLPAEMRKLIYSCVLTQEEPIKLKRFNGRVVQQSFKAGDEDSKPWNNALRKWKSSPDRYATAITEVNKEIHKEATEVLYGTNTFVFRNPQTLSLLADIAPVGFQHLRDIVLVAARIEGKDHLIDAMNVLTDCPHLRSVALSHVSICTSPDDKHPAHPRTPNKMTPRQLADACGPLLRRLDIIRRQKHIMDDVVNVVSVLPCYCFYCKQMREQPRRKSVHCHCKNFAMVTEQDTNFWQAFRDRARLRLALENL